ncbi:MAG TPA: DUF4382 domain-containing protein [Candidatus Acidoferrum sp.]|nr:DUF4382 domain-containing protein [Candidatus Acidoferrum sp.]
MNRSKALSFFSFLMFALFFASACSGPNGGVNCVGTACGGGSGTVAVTMVADTLPAHPSLLTFQVTITSLKFSASGGTSTTVNLSPALTVDLMRLQADSVFLGTFANIPATQYSSVTLVLTGNANITFLNDTGATLSNCPANTICPLTLAASSNPVANLSFTVTQSAVTGIGIDLNFTKSLSISGTPATLAVNFSNSNVLSAFTLPRANSNLASGQLDLIEDFTGVVSLSNSTVTITPATVTGHGPLAATTSSSTIYDADPTGLLCPTGTTQLSSCVKSNQAASMDVVLKSDGTLAIQEIEPLLGTLQDTVEGILVSINSGNQTQFTLVITNLIPAAQSSLIGSLKIGDGLTVNLANAVKPFLVDTKGLPVASQFAAIFGDFANQSNTSAFHLGQTVAVHVIAPFTAAVGTTLASATTDTVTLRWTRFTAATSSASTPAFSITGFPSFFNATGIAQVEAFPATNLDGISGTANLVVPNPVAMRALFIENTSNSAVPAFFAAKVRQH